MSTVSIVMPVYNAEKYLEKTLMGILNQTYTNWRMVVVNDGSTDNSLDIAMRIANISDQQNPLVLHRILIRSRPNQGVSAARNHARALLLPQLGPDDLVAFCHVTPLHGRSSEKTSP